ncbi:hypothetical protein SAMN04489761_3964 [Tenacibaculum sp. MAR_2009_124]|uniref:hypothetical protein n=1 Tax=Tenacibaculum sp. MAR_2009_124 TaxID=1250059 RepID=UPI0008981222|nr:hypothetical protein [Tenacibaculum sp. MAR_2009_124]SEC91927.1 hypothetical protein SAMN04489761_3964 [Tenacibaculum sp. MAR_2009_124]
MKYLFTFICAVFLASCGGNSDLPNNGEGRLTSVSIEVSKTAGEHKGKIKPVFEEAQFFKQENSAETNVFPYKKGYAANLNLKANFDFTYEDVTEVNFRPYSIFVKSLQDNTVISEREFVIEQQGRKVGFNFQVNR